MNHKPNCSINISCAVLHIDGICSGYKKCDCGADNPMPPNPINRLMKPSERIKEMYYEARGNRGDSPELWINRILAYLDEQARKEQVVYCADDCDCGNN